ncbi:DUF4132 domain-containing protein [Dactylosporangium sp. NPDC000521]|uniref:DUF4132 domain-containing protein n=1 Tax=Dactylosporangium sp. NPDC000521 TaxID=3363975 RepID=UPI0036B4D5B2
MDFEFPASWRKVFIPRRGGTPGPALKHDRARGAELISAARGVIDARLDHPDSDPSLVAAARAYLADPSTGPAAGAGVVAALVACHVSWKDTGRLARLADLWIPSRGLLFAAAAVMETVDLDTGGYMHNGVQVPSQVTWRTQPGWGYFPHWVALAGRVRAALAVASDDDHAAVVAMLAGHRDRSAYRRAAAAFLVPTQRDWVDGIAAALAGTTDNYQAKLLWCAASDSAHLAAAAPSGGWWLARDTEALATVVDGAGPAVTPHLLEWLDTGNVDAEIQQRLVNTLALFPTDEAFAALVARLDRKYVPLAALDAARRFPERALRILAADGGRAAQDMLRVHVLAHRDLVAGVSLPPASQARVEAVLADDSAVPLASPSALPELLVTPRWTVRRTVARPAVVPGLTFTAEPVLEWAPGEREAWAARRVPNATWWALDTSIETAVRHYRAGGLQGHHEVTLMLTAPDDVVAELLPGWRPQRVWDAPQWFPQIAARFGLAALPAALHLADAQPGTCTELLLPFASPEVATHMARSLRRLKSLRALVLAWLDRHPAYAARALTPFAVGPTGPDRQTAEEALRIVAVRHRDEVLAAGASFGPDAAAALDTLLGGSTLDVLPAKIPDLPAWADPSLMPRILLKDRSAALGDEPARHLCTMLAISRPDEVYAGVPLVVEQLDRRSLAEFAWAVFTQWQSVGAPPKEPWPLLALQWLGDDDTVRRLSPIIRAWPGEGGHAKAVTGLDVLAGIGSDLALAHLSGIAQKAKFKGLKERAAEKVAEVAASLGLTEEQLADRLVPDLGLDASGSLLLDYGPRQFVVGFDEHLKPYVIDAPAAGAAGGPATGGSGSPAAGGSGSPAAGGSGSLATGGGRSAGRRKDLPKPGVRDDQELAPAAYQRYSGLKKDVRTIAADQIRRLEAAMVSQRRWTAASFQDHVVAHPLLRHIARRLVWTAHLPAGGGDQTASRVAVDGRTGTPRVADDGRTVAFRVAEDGTFADADDEAFALPSTAAVALAHPVLLGAELPAWVSVFADYEILQPFAQLGRAVHALTADERASTSLARFADLKVPTKTILGLERRGWQRGEPQDAGVQCWIWRPAPDNRAIVIDLDPGIPIGAHDIFTDQKLTTVWLNDHPWGTWVPRNLTRTFDALDPVTASEMLRDLTEVLTPQQP